MSHIRGEPRLSRKFDQTMHVGDNTLDHLRYISIPVRFIQPQLRVKQLGHGQGSRPIRMWMSRAKRLLSIVRVIAADTSRFASHN